MVFSPPFSTPLVNGSGIRRQLCSHSYPSNHPHLASAGNYANEQVAISGTGIGEQFQRHVVCHDIAARVEYKGIGLAQVGNLTLVACCSTGGCD